MTAVNTSPTPQHQSRISAREQPIIGVLLVHGLNGSRRDMAELTAVLQSHGMIYTSPTPQHQSRISAREQPIIGVLLVHGLNGSRRDMAELTAVLQSHGMIAENMLLPGHGTNVRDMLSLGW